MRILIEFIAGLVAFVVGTALTFLEALHFGELLEHFAPASVISARSNFILISVGLLLMAAAWLEWKREREAERKLKNIESSLTEPKTEPPPTAASAPSVTAIASPIQTVSPTIEANPSVNASPVLIASPKIEVHNHPAKQGSTQIQRKIARPPLHNIQFLGLKDIWTNLFEEVYDENDGILGIRAGFLNQSIPGKSIADLDYARARVVFRNKQGVIIQEVPRAFWLGRDPDKPLHITAEIPEYILLVIFKDGKWHIPFIIPRLAGYWEEGEHYNSDIRPVPSGNYLVEIILVGEDNLGIQPITVSLGLDDRGEIEFY